MDIAEAVQPGLEQIWAWLDEVADPEIPVISIVDLGIVRDVAWAVSDPGQCVVTVTPTYSGCPATEVIAQQIRQELAAHGIRNLKLQVQLAPAWTTDWLTEKGRQRLLEYGIAPPAESRTQEISGSSSGLVLLAQSMSQPVVACPRCGSTHTETVSQFGSTPCKSLHRCMDCMEPFDHFKCH